MDGQVVTLIGVGTTVVGALIGIAVGRFDIKRGRREDLATEVTASRDIRSHIEGIADSRADRRISDHGLSTLGTRVDGLVDRFDRYEARTDEQFDKITYMMENGLAARIASQIADIFTNAESTVYGDSTPGPKVPITRKSRKTKRTP